VRLLETSSNRQLLFAAMTYMKGQVLKHYKNKYGRALNLLCGYTETNSTHNITRVDCG
jgi:hypothetical protein